MSIGLDSPKEWNANGAKFLAVAALLLPLMGAIAYHQFDLHVFGRILHASSIAVLFMMPIAFRETLNLVFKSDCQQDEMRQAWRNDARRKSYWLIVLVAWLFLFGGSVAAQRNVPIENMSALLETFAMMLVAYAFIFPSVFLAWSVQPLDQD